MANSKGWAETLEPGIRKWFMDEFMMLAQDSRIPILFNVGESDKAEEHDVGVGAFGAWKKYEGNITYQENEQLWKTTYTHEQFVDAIFVERALVDDDQYRVINQRARGLAYGGNLKREMDGASLFNNAFSSAVTGGDAVELCGAHPYSPSNATTQSNAGSTALSYDSVIATQLLMRAFVNDKGDLAPSHGRVIIVPPALQEEAWTIVNTINKPGTANNDGNFAASTGLSVVVWDYLTDTNNWFLADNRLMNLYLNWFDRVPMEFANAPSGDYDLVAKYRGYMRYSFGWSDWRFVYGHEVA